MPGACALAGPPTKAAPVPCARRALIIIVVAIAAWLCPAGRAAQAQVRIVSGTTPFPHGCPVGATPVRDSTAEPSIAVDPHRPLRVVVVWQQDRFNVDGGALSNVLGVSRDGGRTFREVLVPGLSRCTGGSEERATDPWLSFGPDGRLYLASLVFSTTASSGAPPDAGRILVSRSGDGGLTWQEPVEVTPVDGTYNDRSSIAADPRRPGRAYVVLTKRDGSAGGGAEFFSRTLDGGTSWTPPAAIFSPPAGTIVEPGLVEVLRDGSLLNLMILARGSPFFAPGGPPQSWQVLAQRSTDGGSSWGAAVTIALIDPFPAMDPATGQVVRAYPLISGAVAPNGTAYVAFNDISPPTGSRVLLSASTDGGRSWGAPRVVKRSSGQAFLPSLAVAHDGSLGVTYDQTRSSGSGQGDLVTDVWLAHSGDGGAKWSRAHVAGPFDFLSAPESDSSGVQGLFLGDYQGLVALSGERFGAAFAQARPQSVHGPSDMFFAGLSCPRRDAHSPRSRARHRGRRACTTRLNPQRGRRRSSSGRHARRRAS